jgi:hypothetical protein
VQYSNTTAYCRNQIDLGYTIVYVLPDQANKPRVRCLLACCPCFYGGFLNAFNIFWTSGMFKTFIFVVRTPPAIALSE